MSGGHAVTKVVVSKRCAGIADEWFEALGENCFGLTLWLLRVDTAEEVDAYLKLRGEAGLVRCAACAGQVYNYYPHGLCPGCQSEVAS